MYFHRVTSRHWPSPLTHQDAARITQGLLKKIADKLANGKSQKKPGGGAPSRFGGQPQPAGDFASTKRSVVPAPKF